MPTCLIVANQTIASDALIAAVRERLDGGDTDFVLAVPPVPDSSLSGAVSANPQRSSAVGVADGRKLAEQRLAIGLDWLDELGATARGEVVAGDIVDAVSGLVAHEAATEVIVSTLPATISKFLRQDLASKIARKVSIPVTVVTAAR